MESLGIKGGPLGSVVQDGFDPDTYVYGQCARRCVGVHDEAKVFMA